MEKFTKITGFAVPIPQDNVNTDMISPAHVMKAVSKKGLAHGFFEELRFFSNGEKTDFILNKAPWDSSSIIISLKNWGCGSSREHAPWAMYDFGIRSVIAISFADIHYNNCMKNGILPVKLSPKEIKVVMKSAELGEKITVDLQKQQVVLMNNTKFAFEVDKFYRDRLLLGESDISYTLRYLDAIGEFESAQKKSTPWLY